eukprot:1189123-Prorocentrum_minimum.AAC.1
MQFMRMVTRQEQQATMLKNHVEMPALGQAPDAVRKKLERRESARGQSSGSLISSRGLEEV